MHGGLTASPSIEADGRFGRLLTHVPAPVVVALSGGGDSVALLRMAAAWAERNGRPLMALTVDHGLHPDSPAWTRFAAHRAAESGAVFRALRWEGDKPSTGLPAAARAARHALLSQAAREAGASVILLGHTADDVAETERMRAGDAAGIGRLRDWSPSPAWPQGRGVMLVRPLLGVSRADLRAWLTARGDPWLDDPANADRRFARVRVRASRDPAPKTYAPLDESAVARLGETVESGADGGLVLSMKALRAVSEAASLHGLSVAAVCAGGGTRPPRGDSLRRARASLMAGDGVLGLCGARLERRSDRLIVSREPGERERNPRPEADGVIDGRFEVTSEGLRPLVLDRFRAACFLIEREPPPRTSVSP